MIGFVPFDKTPSIDIDDLTLVAIIASQHVEPAHSLTKALAYLGSPKFFLLGQTGDEPAGDECLLIDWSVICLPDLLAFCISPNDAINNR